jgi:hypothetical protein
MAKTKTVRVTEEELAALEAMRGGKAEEAAPQITEAQQALADAFVNAIERTKPVEKKTSANRKKRTPWTPKDGTPKLKMKRVFYHHGIPLGENVSNEEIALLNQLKPGHYCEGFVRVTLRKDRGIDVDHPVRTASQRLKLVNTYGIRSFGELLQRIIDERANPSKYRKPEDQDLFDLD